MRRTEKTVITIETFQRTVVRTRRTTGAGPNENRPEETGVGSDNEAHDQLQRLVELTRAAEAGGDK